MSANTGAYPEDDIVKLASQFAPKHEPLPEMLKDSEAAALLGIGRTKFRQMVRTGKAPKGIKFGRAIRWSRSELLAWVGAGCPPRDKWEAIKKAVKNSFSR